jgi:hypothetical protein
MIDMNYYQDNIYSTQSVDSRVSQVMRSVYLKMFLGLLVTGIVAWFVAATATSDASFLFYMATHPWVYWGLAIVELGLVMWISAGLMRMSSGLATGLFYLFAVVNGLTLSTIFVVYSIAAIFKTFLITAGVFGAMSIYGYMTRKDLTHFGSYLMMGLFGMIILCVINMFWANSTMEWIVSFLGVAIFIGLTAWDTQKIKQIAYTNPSMNDGRLATLGALSLYLDFINLFLYLLRFLNNNRD